MARLQNTMLVVKTIRSFSRYLLYQIGFHKKEVICIKIILLIICSENPFLIGAPPCRVSDLRHNQTGPTPYNLEVEISYLVILIGIIYQDPILDKEEEILFRDRCFAWSKARQPPGMILQHCLHHHVSFRQFDV